MQDMKEYLNAHGTKNIPQNRIRDCLAEQCIVSKGGKRILQWRWEQFVKGKPVRRTTEFLKSRQIPKYLLLPSEPCIVLLKWKPSVIDSQILEILYINLPSRWERCKDTIITLIESVQRSNCSVTWIRNVLTRSFLDILVRNTLAKGNHIFTCHDDCIKIYPK